MRPGPRRRGISDYWRPPESSPGPSDIAPPRSASVCDDLKLVRRNIGGRYRIIDGEHLHQRLLTVSGSKSRPHTSRASNVLPKPLSGEQDRRVTEDVLCEKSDGDCRERGSAQEPARASGEQAKEAGRSVRLVIGRPLKPHTGVGPSECAVP